MAASATATTSRKRRTGPLISWWVGLVVVFASCGSPPDRFPTTDAGNADAASCAVENCGAYVCDEVFGSCFRSCQGPEMCADGFACEGGACVGTECTVETSLEVCGAYACVNGICVDDCTLGACADGYYCRGDTDTCEPLCVTRTDESCDGFLCDLQVGECESYCLDGELACAPGYACLSDSTCTEDLSAALCASGCGAYACVEHLNRCATHCVTVEDCASGMVCDAGQCVANGF